MVEKVVHLILTWASLLSGELRDCQSPDDATCQGGVAAVSALRRQYVPANENFVMAASFDKSSPFVQMHSLGWCVNRVVFKLILGLHFFMATPSLLTQSSKDFPVSRRDLSDCQSRDLPLLLTNVAVPPSSTWFMYTQPIHFDPSTGLAVLSVANSDEPLNWPQVESAKGMLDFVARINAESGCDNSDPYNIYARYRNFTTNFTDLQQTGNICWIPVVYFDDNQEMWDSFLANITTHDNPPALLIDLGGLSPAYATPTRVGPHGVWVLSYPMDSEIYFQQRLVLDSKRHKIARIELITDSLDNKTDSVKDEQYDTDIQFLRQLADEALQNDPVVGSSTEMPAAQNSSIQICKAGECPIGDLFTDSARWWGDADVAFVTSGGLRGPGWPAGPVHISDIWAALPFPNVLCNGVMNGISLFRLLNYSVSVATFQGEDTSEGGRLLQVSGMRVKYNTLLQGGSRLISIDIWNETARAYLPIERLRLYKFVSDSYLCGVYDPYPSLLRDELVMAGEVPGVIGYVSHQSVIGEYLAQLSRPYNASVEGRLVNNTSIFRPLNLIESQDECAPGTYWDQEDFSCYNCPVSSNVAFLTRKVDANVESGSNISVPNSVTLVNAELYTVAVVPKSVPSFVTLTGLYRTRQSEESNQTMAEMNYTIKTLALDTTTVTLASGESVEVEFGINALELEPSTNLGTVSFGVLDGGNYPGCVGQDATFDVLLTVYPPPVLNQLGPIRFVGWTLAGIAMFLSFIFGTWVVWNRQFPLVRTMQPVFLVTICVGVFVMASAIIPISIDDEIASEKACDAMCMLTPWLVSMGFTVTMSALFSKLWRINRLFQARGRKIVIHERDVITPAIILFALNVTFLLIWTTVDPVEWSRHSMPEQPWNSYGRCLSFSSLGTVSKIMLSLVIAVNGGALILALVQAYRARNISGEFSESRHLGVALLGWLQLLIVGFPMIFLIDKDNAIPRYFLEVSLLFAVCMSMLLLIFVPVLIKYRADLNKKDGGILMKLSSDSPERRFSVHDLGKTRVSGVDYSGLSDRNSCEFFRDPSSRADTLKASNDGLGAFEKRDAYSEEDYGLDLTEKSFESLAAVDAETTKLGSSLTRFWLSDGTLNSSDPKLNLSDTTMTFSDSRLTGGSLPSIILEETDDPSSEPMPQERIEI